MEEEGTGEKMIIREEICVGCGRCQPFCPTGAIRYDGLKSAIDQDVCYECGTCRRNAECPVDALAESSCVFDYPRAVRKYFSDPVATHEATGIQGRGTEETKTNDVTHRCGPGEVGIAIEVGRPTIGMSLLEVQKITRALARSGIHEIEKHNPIHSMIADEATGDLKPELLGERVLSAIIELQVEWSRAPRHPPHAEGGREGGGRRLLHRRIYRRRSGAEDPRRGRGGNPGGGVCLETERQDQHGTRTGLGVRTTAPEKGPYAALRFRPSSLRRT